MVGAVVWVNLVVGVWLSLCFRSDSSMGRSACGEIVWAASKGVFRLAITFMCVIR